jgi:membrane-associated phospholipid phosphatase
MKHHRTSLTRSCIGRATFALVALCGLGACASVPGRPEWGADATYRPGWDRIGRSAVAAARDPWVWGPLLAAGAVQIDNADHRISDWAREHTPVFGSQDNAARWSDDLRSASSIAWFGTALATPSGDFGATWVENKFKGWLVGLAAWTATGATTDVLKSTTDRERPDGSDTKSFPSGHVSRSAVMTGLASRNLDSMDLGTGTRQAMNIGLDALTIGTAWARVEAGAHFPSDTLFSMALGNFCASFFNDAFLAPASDAHLAVRALPRGAMLEWDVSF